MNQFAAATWLTPPAEREEPRFYSTLEKSKWMPQVLVLSLASIGRVMIAGDLYHYAPERAFHREPPANEFDVQQAAASRAKIEEYLKATKTAIWIEHEWASNAKLKKAPQYYE